MSSKHPGDLLSAEVYVTLPHLCTPTQWSAVPVRQKVMMTSTLILSTLNEEGPPRSLKATGVCLIPLNVDQMLAGAIDALDRSLRFHPPTSLADAKHNWLPEAAKLASELTLQAARVGEELDWDEVPERFSQVLVVSERVLPIDLLPCRESLLGTECIVAHRGVGDGEQLDLISVSKPECLPLRRIAHVSAYHPGRTSLHDLDVVAATLGIDNRLAVEHYLYPQRDVSVGLFERRDIDVLHFECHGTSTSLQVDNPFGEPVDVRQRYNFSGPKVYSFFGCCAGKSVDSTASMFVRKGARAALGAYCEFLSGGNSGEVSLTAFYDTLYQAIVDGRALGESVRAGRQAAAPERIYYCSWLLFGNPNVNFSTQWFGREAPNPYEAPGSQRRRDS